MKRLCSVNKVFPFLFEADGTTPKPREADTYESEWLHVGSLHELLVLVNVEDVGSPALEVTLQTSPNASTAFVHTTYNSITGKGQYLKPVTNFGKFVRVQAVVSAASHFEAFIVAKS